MAEFDGKTAFITGGASGMALLAGRRLAAQGARVALIDVDRENLEKGAASIRSTGGVCLPLVADVRRYGEIEKAVADTEKKLGAIDILLNVAGGMSGRCCRNQTSFEKLPIEVIDWGIDVNLRGAIYCARAIIGKMMERRRGVIVNFGSVTGEEGAGGSAVDYAAEKSGMNGLTKSLAILGAPYGVRACCVIPGPVLTRPDMAGMKTILGRAARPEEAVDFVLYLCSDKASFITGSSHLVDGGRMLVRG